MKLLYITSQINVVGGLAKILTEKINWLIEHGYGVSLCNIENVEIMPAYQLNPKVKLVKGDVATIPGGFFTRAKEMIYSIRKIYRIILTEKPDIIINVHCPLVSWYLPFVHVKTPKIIEIHQSKQGLEVFNRTYLSLTHRIVQNTVIRLCYGLYDKFVVLTSEDKKEWNLPNCLVIPNFIAKASLQEFKRKKRIVMLARLVPQKRIDLMIEIWARLVNKHPDWTVHVWGEGQERADLEQLVKKMSLENSFFFEGETKERSVIDQELSESSILCLTSEYEGFPLSVLEAMQHKLPIIVFNVAGIHDLVNDDKNGFIISPFGDIDLYAKKLSILISDYEMRERMGLFSKEKVSYFEMDNIMKEWVSLFNSFLVKK